MHRKGSPCHAANHITDILGGNLRPVGDLILVRLVGTLLQFIAIHRSESADSTDLWL